MNQLLQKQIKWLREEKEIERMISNNIEKDATVTDADKGGAFEAISERVEMLESIEQTLIGCGYMMAAFDKEDKPVKKTWRDFLWLTIIGLIVGGAMACMLIEIFGRIKCPCI